MSRAAPGIPLVLCLVAACSGGGKGGSSPAVGLTTPTSLTLLPPSDPTAVPDPGGFPAGADYFEDAVELRVRDAALGELALASRMLDALGELGTGALFDGVTYLAELDGRFRETGTDDGALLRPRGRSAAAGQGAPELWVVESTRPGSGANQDLRVWGAWPDGAGSELDLFGEAILRRAPDVSRPFGEFELFFVGADDVGSIDTPRFEGMLASTRADGRDGFVYYEVQGDLQEVPAPGETARVLQAAMATDGSGGVARIFESTRGDLGAGDTGIVPAETLLAFDATHLLRRVNGGAPTAYLRSDVRTHALRYGLYEAGGVDAGQRVEPDAGFGFLTGNGAHGRMGARGIELPEGVSLFPGETVVSEVPGGGAPYTVFSARGRLVRYRKLEIDLSELGPRNLDWIFHDSAAGTTTQFRVVFDESTGFFSKTGVLNAAGDGYDPLAPEVLDTALLGVLDLYSDGLGGPCAYVHGMPFLFAYAAEVVDGSDDALAGGDLALEGFQGCLRADVTGVEAETGDVFLPDAPDLFTPNRYVFDATDLTLRHDVLGDGSTLAVVGLANGEAPATGPFVWGLRSGPLVTPGAGLGGISDAWALDELYVYETGPHPWNGLLWLVDSGGVFVDVAPPRSFLYRHAIASDRNGEAAHDGRAYVLEEDRVLGLRGIPREAVDLDGDGSDDHFLPLLSLADGTLLGPTGTEWVVKALEVEETLAEDPAYAGALDFLEAGDLVVPGSASLATPDIGPAPSVPGPPSVVLGAVVLPAEEGE